MPRVVLVLATLSFAVFVAWIIYMADTAQHTVFFDWVKATPYGDKLGHVFLFGLLVLGLNAIFAFRACHVGPWRVYWGTLVIASIATLEECSQSFFPNRTLDVFDLLADAVGIGLFTAISYLMTRIRWPVNAP